MKDFITYMILNNKPYFKLADEFVTLEQRFKKESRFETLMLWVDMLLYPIYTLCSILFFGKRMDIFTILSAQKTFTIWTDWVRYKQLQREIHEWTKIVRSVGGPFISTNDETYHVFVYADGMQRLYDDLFRSGRHGVLPKEGIERL